MLLFLKGKSGKEIHCKLTTIYEPSALSYAQVKFCIDGFKLSRTSLEDKSRSEN